MDSVNDTDATVLGRLVQAGAYPGGGGKLTLLSEQVGVDELLVVLMGNLSSDGFVNRVHEPDPRASSWVLSEKSNGFAQGWVGCQLP